MFFTIIIPTRNRSSDLKTCLKHIKLQTYSDYEVLVIDDGSNLNTVTQYAESIPSDDRFKLLNINAPTVKGLGASVSRNIGLENAKGFYITFCDDDDYWTDNNHLLIAYKTLNNTNIDMYIANQNAVSSNGQVMYNDWFPLLTGKTSSYKSISTENNTYLLSTKQLLMESEIPQLNTLVLKKSICTKINGFWQELMYVEDRDFYLRALEHCNNICYRKDIVSQHNIPDPKVIKSISNSISEYEQHVLMISVLNHVLTTTNRKEIIQFCTKFLGWKYRNLALITQSKPQLIFARSALINLFTVKWFLFTQYLNIKYIIKFAFRIK